MRASIEQMLVAAVKAQRSGLTAQAHSIYKAILSAEPEHPEANHLMGLCLAAVGRKKAAASHLEMAVKANPAVPEFWIKYIASLIDQKRREKALKVIKIGKNRGLIDAELSERLIALCPAQKESSATINAPSQQELDRLLERYLGGHYGEAKNQAERLIREFPNHPFSWKILGVSLTSLGEIHEALIVSEKALELDPADAEIYTNIGGLYRAMGQLEKAEASLRLALELRPYSAESHSNLGVILKDLGSRQDAMRCFEKAIALEPNSPQAYNNLGYMHRATGNLEIAESYLNRACELRPDFADAYNNLGLVLKEQGRLNEAQRCFEQALQRKADFAEALNNLGTTLQALNKSVSAEEAFRQSISISPDVFSAHNNLGITLHALGRVEEAVASYNLARALATDNPEVHNNLGLAIEELGDSVQAEELYRRALMISPDYAEAYSNLGNLLASLGRKEEAESCYSSAIEIKPNFSLARMNRWTLLMSKGNFKAALADADACGDFQGRSLALETLHVMGEIDEAYRRIRENACRDQGNIRSAAFAAFIAVKEGRPTAHKFCPKPLSFLHFSNLASHVEDVTEFSKNVVRQLKSVETVWEPRDKSTKNGFQTTNGMNLFEQPNLDLACLRSIVLQELHVYREKFKNEACALIEKWPRRMDLYAWHVILRQQGFQERHLHPEGWLSGVVYLQVVPQHSKDEGAIEFGLDGTNYQCQDSPKLLFNPQMGDIVFFPSSLHHRTVPFCSKAERVSVAFDLLPARELEY